MLIFATGFALGVVFLQHRAELPLPDVPLWSLPACLLLAWMHWRIRGASVPKWVTQVPLLAVAVAAGFLWASHRAHVRMADELPTAWEARDIAVVGVVTGLPSTQERAVRFQFAVERIDTDGAVVPRLVSLSWWGKLDAAGRLSGIPALHAGERWSLRVRLKRPHGTMNPHASDYEAWLLERGIRATGVVRPGSDLRPIARDAGGVATLVDRIRERLRARILESLAGYPYAGVIVALTLGDQRAIPPEQWQTYTRTGVNHLISISGLHVTMISGLVHALVSGLWRRRPRLAVALPAQKAAVAGGLLAALGYTLLAGFEVPAQRTLYMLAAGAAVLWFDAAAAWSAVLAFALVTVLVLDPWAVLSAGFWLSFGAVAIIMFLNENRLSRPGWIAGWWSVQWGITLALVPVTIGLFQQVSLVSPLANAFAIPVVSLAVVPLSLAALLLPVDWGLQLAHGVLVACMVPLEWLAEMPHAVWQQHAPPWWAVFMALAGALWTLLPRQFPARASGVLAFLPLLNVGPPPVQNGEARVTVLDVGQGLAVTVVTANHALTYDTGPAYGPDTDAGQRTVVPFLRGEGVRRLDLLVVSHDDIDHTGGAASVLETVSVDRVLTSLPELDPLRFRTDRFFRCQAGQQWTWDGVRFDVLHPAAVSYALPLKDNDRSCVIKVTTAHGSMLLTADAERWAENTMVQSVAASLAADVLLAPHQGSRTSSTPSFVEAVNPAAVIFPYGYRNRFGHPHADVVERYASRGIDMYRTATDGAIRIEFRHGGWTIIRYREEYRRYWHDR